MTVDFSMTVPLSTNVGTTALELSSNIPASADRRRAGSSDALKSLRLPFNIDSLILTSSNNSIRKEAIMAEDIQVKREITLEADAETLEKMRKEGHARGFTVYCDEGERIGGDNSAPPPLAYFGLSLAF